MAEDDIAVVFEVLVVVDANGRLALPAAMSACASATPSRKMGLDCCTELERHNRVEESGRARARRRPDV